MSSDDRKRIDSFLAEIGAAVGKNIRLNENGISAFTYDHLTFVIEVPENVSSFFIYTTLFPLARFTNGILSMKKILQLNYLQQETRGGCIGVDPTNDDVIFSYSDRINEINSTEFRNVLENFIDTSIQLYKVIETADSGEDQPAAVAQQDLMAQNHSSMNASLAKQLQGGSAPQPKVEQAAKKEDGDQSFKPPVGNAIMP